MKKIFFLLIASLFLFCCNDNRQYFYYDIYHYGKKVGRRCLPEGLSGVEWGYGGAENFYKEQTDMRCEK